MDKANLLALSAQSNHSCSARNVQTHYFLLINETRLFLCKLPLNLAHRRVLIPDAKAWMSSSERGEPKIVWGNICLLQLVERVRSARFLLGFVRRILTWVSFVGFEIKMGDSLANGFLSKRPNWIEIVCVCLIYLPF